MRASPALSKRLPPRGKRRRLEPEEIRALVESVRAGLDSPANLEGSGPIWRLRLTINRSGGGSVRRGFTIRDKATADWVADYLEKARSAWLEHCREARNAKTS